MERIYKLRYTDREQAIADLQEKGVIEENENFKLPIHAVVELGILERTPATETEEATYREGYHFDVMSSIILRFPENRVTNITNEKHTFAK